MVGGDSLETVLRVEAGAHCLATSPAADKLYRVEGAGIQHRLALAHVHDAVLEWLPQPVICFDGARGELGTALHLHGCGRVIAWDVLCLGRDVGNEPFRSGSLALTTELWRDGEPLLRERLALAAEGALMRSPAGMGGATVLGTILCCGEATSLGRALQELSPLTAASSHVVRECGVAGSRWGEGDFRVTLRGGVFVGRYLGMDAGRAWECLVRAWEMLRPLVLDIPPCRPRIWET
jgi:urease accessory protein